MYDDPAVMQVEIDKYFAACDKGEEIEVYDKKRQEVHKINRKTPYTVPGIVYALGFGDDKGLQEYKQKKEFSHIIARAWKRIELQRNEKAITGEHDPKFSQFDLNCNFKWIEKKELSIPELTQLSDEELDERLKRLIK